jgi:hypothetical protein
MKIFKETLNIRQPLLEGFDDGMDTAFYLQRNEETGNLIH